MTKQKNKFIKGLEEKRAAMAALQARIAAASAGQEAILQQRASALEQLEIQKQNMEDRERSLNLIIDSEGRTIDKRTGEVIQIQSRMPTLKANIKVQKKDQIKTPGDKKANEIASGIASTMTGISTVISEAPTVIPPTPVPESEISQNFFDSRLKLKNFKLMLLAFQI